MKLLMEGGSTVIDMIHMQEEYEEANIVQIGKSNELAIQDMILSIDINSFLLTEAQNVCIFRNTANLLGTA